MTESDSSLFSVIIAANNEEDYIGACLDALLAQVDSGPLDVVVVANACSDKTEEIVNGYAEHFAMADHRLQCLHLEQPGKVGALNAGDAAATGSIRAYLDADVICEKMLFGQLRKALAIEVPRYATGTLTVAPARSWITRQYARFWQQLPFVKGGAVGTGLFSVNAAGRALWGAFPDIISDDTFVRLQFIPEQRIEVSGRYHWPMIEGWNGLVKVRRRQDAGVRQVRMLYPDLASHEGKAKLSGLGILRLAVRDPIAFAVYACVHFAVRTGAHSEAWVRGR